MNKHEKELLVWGAILTTFGGLFDHFVAAVAAGDWLQAAVEGGLCVILGAVLAALWRKS